jgi:hypothetical protein
MMTLWPAVTEESLLEPLTTVIVCPLTVAFHGSGAVAGACTVTGPVIVKPVGTVTMICRRKCDGPLRMLFVRVKLKFVGAPAGGTSLGWIVAV